MYPRVMAAARPRLDQPLARGAGVRLVVHDPGQPAELAADRALHVQEAVADDVRQIPRPGIILAHRALAAQLHPWEFPLGPAPRQHADLALYPIVTLEKQRLNMIGNLV